MKKLFALLLTLIMVLSLVACGGGGEQEADDQSSETPKLAFIPPTMQAEYFQWNLAGIEQKAAELGLTPVE